MRHLVTGGAGFLGSHLCERLIAANDEVIILDNFTTGRMLNVHNKAKLYEFDIVEHWTNEEWAKLDYDYVWNFACPASPPAYQANPFHTMMTCVVGTKNMASFAYINDAVFVHASTSEVYGDPLEHPQKESYRGNVNTHGPRSCYDVGKMAAESLISDHVRISGLRAKVVRIFNTYGPRMRPDDGRVVSNFVCQALQNKKLTVYGDGSQTRSFCYVDDLIDGIQAYVATDVYSSDPVNVGNPHEFKMIELAREIYSHLGKELTIDDVEFNPLPQDDPRVRCPDIAKIKGMTGWTPKISLRDGILKTIEYFKLELEYDLFNIHG